MKLSVLPRPKKLTARKGLFRFTGGIPIVLSPRADEAERLAAWLLADSVADLGGPPPSVERHGKLDGLPGPTVGMFLIGRDETLCPDLKKLKAGRQLGREGYAVQVSPKHVLAAANSSAGLFYAAQTLVQLLTPRPPSAALPCCRVLDWPDFPYRGFMLDVSRFRVPKSETLADLVFRLAACKINVLQLYVEHTFRCRRRPTYSEGVSPLTAEQLSDLDQLCAMLHIELQANQNSLGHMQHLLSRAEFAHLAERPPGAAPVVKRGRTLPTPWSFRLDSPEVYRLLDDIYAEHLTAVRSPLVNLGCDEAWDMGLGRSRRLVARKGEVKAFVDHVGKIAKLAAKYGKQAMIWDDMIRTHREVLTLLPEEVIPVFWHYGEKPEPNYRRIWAGSGRRHWMAPGCCTWTSIFSQIDRAWRNIHWMTSAGRRGGAEGILNTEWGDRGNFQTLAPSYMSIAIGAELSWNSKPIRSKADFDRRFARALFDDRTGRMGRLYRLLGTTNHVFGKLPYHGPTFDLYWDRFPDGEHLVAYADDPGLDRCEKLAADGLALAREIRTDPPPAADDVLFEELISAADQTLFACRKTRLAARVRAALGRQGKLPAAVKREVRKLAADWATQKIEFKRVWLLRNQPAQINYRLGLYDERKRDFRRLLAGRKR